MKKNKRALWLLLLLSLTACAKNIEVHGFNFESAKLQNLNLMHTKEEEILEALGTPTAVSDFGDRKLYYIETTCERVGFYHPKIVGQKVLILHIDKKGLLTHMNELSLNEANTIKFSDTEIGIEGNKLTPLQQIIGNIGRYTPKK